MARALFALAILLLVSVAPARIAHADAPASLRSAGVSREDWSRVESAALRASQAYNLNQAALLAVAENLGLTLSANGRLDVDQILASIDSRARILRQVLDQLGALERADDPEVARLVQEARGAASTGELARADGLLAQAIRLDMARALDDRFRANVRRMRAAITIAQRGQLASNDGRLEDAERLFGEAVDAAPEGEVANRWQFAMWQAQAISDFADRNGDIATTRRAIAAMEQRVVPLSSRTQRPDQWVQTQIALANMLSDLAERGEAGARERAQALLEMAVEAAPQNPSALIALAQAYMHGGYAGDPTNVRRIVDLLDTALPLADDRAQVLATLSAVYRSVGDRGDRVAMLRSINYGEQVLAARSREEAPQAWANAASALANSLQWMGQRRDPDALYRAIDLYEQAIVAYGQAGLRAARARTQVSLSEALTIAARNGDAGALDRAEAALSDAVSVIRSVDNPAGYVDAQHALGVTLRVIGQRRNDPTAFARSIAALESALAVAERTRYPVYWAMVQNSYGRTLMARGDAARSLADYEAAGVLFRRALEVWTPLTFPEQAAIVNGNLADLEQRMAALQ